jgi:hypothetical protein
VDSEWLRGSSGSEVFFQGRNREEVQTEKSGTETGTEKSRTETGAENGPEERRG